MKLYFTILLLFVSLINFGQPSVNERFDLGYDGTIYGSVIATDSCYYFISIAGNANENADIVFMKYRIDNEELITNTYSDDTMHLDPWQSNNLIKTLDGSFAQIIRVTGDNSNANFMFVKYDSNGDTILTNYFNELNINENKVAIQPCKIVQNSDSTYFTALYYYSTEQSAGMVYLLKLSKKGEVMWFNTYDSNFFSITWPERIRCRDFIKYDTNILILGTTIDNQHNDDESSRAHTKLIFTDTLGNILNERIYDEDRINFEVRGLTKTIDNGLLYCGQVGEFLDDEGGGWIGFKGQITKLDANFDLEWRLELGHYASELKMDFNQIVALNETEFVAVGNTRHNGYENNNGDFTRYGWLVKFNIDGEIIWERKYVNVPPVPTNIGGMYHPDHVLHDIDITKDSGFVMVGQVVNFRENEYLYGQQGWLLKVDKYGCLVPGCEQYDNIDTTTVDTSTVDTTIFVVNDSLQMANNGDLTLPWPNPVDNELYYYHTESDTSEMYQTNYAYIYNSRGKIVNQWALNENNMTYIANVSEYEAGMYVLKVVSNSGIILRTHKIIVEH